MDAWVATLHPEDLERVKSAIQAHLNEAVRYDLEYRVRRKDGVYRWWSARGAATRTPDGKPLRWFGSVTDITDRKRMEAELRASEERFRTIFERAGVGVALVGLDGRWMDINAKLCEILLYPREEMLQKSFQEVTFPDDLASDLELVRRTMIGEIPGYKMEKRYVRKDGSIAWVLLSVALVRSADGQPKHFISVVEDLTARKEAEAAITQQLDELRRWQEVMLDREDRVQELKQEVNGLAARLGLPLKYPSQAAGAER